MNCPDIQYEIAQYLKPFHYSCISKAWYKLALQYNALMFPHLYYSGNYSILVQWIVKNNIGAKEIITHILRGRIKSSKLIDKLGRIFKPEPIFHNHFDNAIKNKNVILVKFIKNCVKWHSSNKLDYKKLIMDIDVEFFKKVGVTHYDLLVLVDYYYIVLWYSYSHKELEPLVDRLDKIILSRHSCIRFVDENSYESD